MPNASGSYSRLAYKIIVIFTVFNIGIYSAAIPMHFCQLFQLANACCKVICKSVKTKIHGFHINPYY